MILRSAVLLLSLGCAVSAPAQILDPLVVSAARHPLPPSALPYTVEVIGASDRDASPARMLDDQLKRSAAFSLFRRTGSLSANPTAQGVSLRNLAPSGAGRTLVLLDGVPLNDPFGGWVAWAKTSPLAPTAVEIVRGGGSGVWGSAALGGTIQIVSPPTTDLSAPLHGLRLEAGDFGTIAAAARTTHTAAHDTWTVDLSGFHSDGFQRKASPGAGPIDTTTDLDQALVQVGWSHRFAHDIEASLQLRGFAEDRGNGTPLQRNRTRELMLSGQLRGTRDDATWQVSAYAQTQEFRSLFTAVDATRTTESPVLDQYAVPADAAGGAATLTWSEPHATTTVGADVRWVQGETRENYFRVDDAFVRNRRAGGTQLSGGLFASHNRQLAPDWRLDAALRLDGWTLRDGHRLEIDRTTGAPTRTETYADRSDVEFNPRLGIIWQFAPGWRWTAAAYQAHRLPTLNELYRPFRVGSVITEANPLLDPEHLTGAETGFTWQSQNASLRASVFANRIEDAVANVTLGYGPGVVPDVGFVPAGGIGRQRQNLDRVDVLGVELGGSWAPDPTLTLHADYLYSDARDATTDQWLPQVPRHTVVLGAAWRPLERWSIDAQARHVSDAYEDDGNTLVLDAATTFDLRIAYAWQRGSDVFLAVENLTDEIVIAGRSADGLVDLGTPRFVRGGVTWRW